MRIIKKVTGIGLLVILLALIRFFEASFFYDPLMEFFLSEYLHNMLPEFDTWKLLTHVFFRFWLNTSISLLIIYVAFGDKNILNFSLLLYSVLFIGCFGTFIYLVLHIQDEQFMLLFYVRRFLIHPIFVIILLPAFYYYRLQNSAKAEQFQGGS